MNADPWPVWHLGLLISLLTAILAVGLITGKL